MCQMSLYPPGVLPDLQHLQNAAEVNYDGSGFAIVMDGYLIVRRASDGAALAEEFAFARAAYSDHWAAFHSRLATRLKPSPEHVHPFTVGGDTRTVLFHNGSLPFEEDLIERGDLRSDSRYLAEELGGLTRSEQHLTTLAGPRNKIAVLSADPGREECVIASRDQWLVTPEGVLHSNPDYLGKGEGWRECTDDDGDLYRWNPFREGQCKVCHQYGCEFWDSNAYELNPDLPRGKHDSAITPRGYRAIAARMDTHCEPAPVMRPRFRNETRRIEGLR